MWAWASAFANVCECVCVRKKRERERERENLYAGGIYYQYTTSFFLQKRFDCFNSHPLICITSACAHLWAWEGLLLAQYLLACGVVIDSVSAYTRLILHAHKQQRETRHVKLKRLTDASDQDEYVQV